MSTVVTIGRVGNKMQRDQIGRFVPIWATFEAPKCPTFKSKESQCRFTFWLKLAD